MAPSITIPPCGSLSSKGPYDSLVGTHGLLEEAVQKEWPNIFTNLEMVTGPPALFIPAKLELLSTPERHPTDSSPQRLRDEIMQRVDYPQSNLSCWSRTCAKQHHLLRERDRYIHELRRRIFDNNIFISG